MADESVNIGKLIKQLIGYWKIYIPIGIICLIAGVLYILVTPKEYEICGRMQLIADQQGMTSELRMLKSAGMGAILGGGGGGVNSNDEVFLITSRNNLVETIRQTEYQVETRTTKGLKSYLFDKDESPVSYLFSPSFLDTISTKISIKLSIEDNKIAQIKVKSSLFNEIEFKNQSLPFDIVLPRGVITVLSNSKNGTFVTTISPLQKVYETLHETIKVLPPETISNILLLECNAENRQRGCRLINSIMQTYNEYSRKTKKSEAEVDALFVKERLDTITTELAFLEHRIEVYKQSNNMPDPGLYGSMTYMGNKETERLILETETRLRIVDYVINYINSPTNINSVIPLMDGVGDAAISAYNQLIFTRQRLALSSEVDNPALKLVDNQLKEQHKILAESVENIRKNIKINLDVLYKENSKLDKQVTQLPTQEREYIEMIRQQKIKESIYLFLLQKLQEKELANSPSELTGRVVDSAYSSYLPIFPKSSIVLSVAFLVACILSLIAIGLKEFVFCKK